MDSVYLVSCGVNYDGYLAQPRDLLAACSTLEAAREIAMDRADSLVLWAGPAYFIIEKALVDQPQNPTETVGILTKNGAEWEWSVISSRD